MSTLKNLVDVILVFFLNNHICIIYGWKICIPSFKEKPTNCLSSGSSKFNVGYACVLAFNRPSGETFTAEKQRSRSRAPALGLNAWRLPVKLIADTLSPGPSTELLSNTVIVPPMLPQFFKFQWLHFHCNFKLFL